MNRVVVVAAAAVLLEKMKVFATGHERSRAFRVSLRQKTDSKRHEIRREGKQSCKKFLPVQEQKAVNH